MKTEVFSVVVQDGMVTVNGQRRDDAFAVRLAQLLSRQAALEKARPDDVGLCDLVVEVAGRYVEQRLTTSGLLRILQQEHRAIELPDSANRMGAALRRIEPLLLDRGIGYRYWRSNGVRYLVFELVA